MPVPADFEHWRPVHLVAQWHDVPLATGALAHPETVWAALNQVETPERPNATVKYYALRIRIEGIQVALATIVKPLIDGVVSSLHSVAGEIPDRGATLESSHDDGQRRHSPPSAG